MEKVICVTFFLGNDITLYANMKNSNLVSHNSSYLKTVVCFFSSARFFSKDVKLAFFVNDIQALVSLENGYYKNILEHLGVEIIEVTPRFVDPKKKWAGSMFVFDAIENILNQKDTQPDTEDKKGYFFFDTDVIFLNHFERVFNIIEKYNWGGYATYTEYCRGNNNWLEDFHGINFETDNKDAIPYGGEFLYLDNHTIDIFFNVFKDIYSEKRNIYYTEEHYYSAILNTPTFLDKRGIDVHTFFKRVWRINKSLDDQYAWALHFPGEKNYKLNYLFNELIKNNFIFDPNKAKKILGVNTFFNYYDFKRSVNYLTNVVQKFKGKIRVN